MARNPNVKGGWFRCWGKQWLENQKLINLGDEGEAAWVRLLCAANCVSWKTGRFEWENLKIPLTPQQICSKARVSMPIFNLLLANSMIRIDDLNTYFIPNWLEYQHPKANSDFNSELNSPFQLPINSSKSGTKKGEEGGRKGNTLPKNFLPPFSPPTPIHQRNDNHNGNGNSKHPLTQTQIARRLDDLYATIDKPNLPDHVRIAVKSEIRDLENSL